MAAPPLKVWRLDLLFSWLATVVKASGPMCPLGADAEETLVLLPEADEASIGQF